MKAELKFDCENCLDDVTLTVNIFGKTMPSFSSIMRSAENLGWSIGRDCYCPNCLDKLPAHCKTCEYFEGNKSMGDLLCRKDGRFTTANDYCKEHKYFYGYKESEGDVR